MIQTTPSTDRIFTTGQLAEILGVETWHVQRVFEHGDVPEPQRFAGRRAIPSAMIPAIVDALRARGWLPVAASPSGERP